MDGSRMQTPDITTFNLYAVKLFCKWPQDLRVHLAELYSEVVLVLRREYERT